MVGYQTGRPECLKALYLQFMEELFNYGQKITQDAQLIEDAIQETFIAIWKYRQNLNVPQSPRHYLFKTFRNHLFSILKQRSKTDYTDESMRFQFQIAFEDRFAEGEDAKILSQKINRALSALTDRQREIIYYRFYENLSFDEIAEIMDMQTRATYKLTARALSALREVMHPGTLKFLIPFF